MEIGNRIVNEKCARSQKSISFRLIPAEGVCVHREVDLSGAESLRALSGILMLVAWK